MQTKIDTLSKPYFLMTWIRSPVSRCLSHAYYIAGGGGGHAPTRLTTQGKLKALNTCTNYNFKYIWLPEGYNNEMKAKKPRRPQHSRRIRGGHRTRGGVAQQRMLPEYDEQLDDTIVDMTFINHDPHPDFQRFRVARKQAKERYIARLARGLSPEESKLKLSPLLLNHVWGWIMNPFRDTSDLNLSMSQSKHEAARMVEDYDFIGIADRFQDSMLVLKHILGVRICDILYLKSKDSSDFEKEQQCEKEAKEALLEERPELKVQGDKAVKKVLHKGKLTNPKTMKKHKRITEEPEAVQRLANSTKFHDANAADFELMRLVGDRLDYVIEHAIGRERFEAERALYDEMLAASVGTCGLEAQGKCIWDKQQCLWRDGGCGYKCMDNQVCPLFDEKERRIASKYGLKDKTKLIF